MAIHALFVGCDYPGESCQLPDCALDARHMAEALEPHLASGRLLTNEHAERQHILDAIAELKAKAKKSDVVILYYSGHGTYDTIKGKRVQGIVPNDLQVIYEVELRQQLADFGQAVYIADSCFSGGLSRGKRKSRYTPIRNCFTRAIDLPAKTPKRPHVVYSACRENETAASTGEGGAFTLALLDVFSAGKSRTTLKGLAAGVAKLLPSDDYQQHPTFWAADDSFARRTIGSFAKNWNKRK